MGFVWTWSHIFVGHTHDSQLCLINQRNQENYLHSPRLSRQITTKCSEVLPQDPAAKRQLLNIITLWFVDLCDFMLIIDRGVMDY